MATVKTSQWTAFMILVACGLPMIPGAACFAFPAEDYLPLPDNATWTYTGGFSNAVVNGETLVNGVPTKQLLDSNGDSEFFTNDTNGIRMHRIGTSFQQTTVSFAPPIPFANAQANIGDQLVSSGTADFVVPGAGTFGLAYTSSSSVVAAERITVPFGTFDTIRLVVTFSLTGNVQGTPINETSTSTLWLAPGIGVVRDDEGPFGVLELVSTNVQGLIPSPALLTAILPGGRSGLTGGMIPAFATMINISSNPLTGCQISPITPVPATFLYQTTDPLSNALTGTPNTPVDLIDGQAQSFLIAFTPAQAFGATEISFDFSCTGVDSADVVPGVNTLILSASDTPVPDMIALAASIPPGQLVLDSSGVGAFTVATINVGAAGTVTVSADTGSANLPVSIALCETDPVNSSCINPVTPTAGAVTVSTGAGTAQTFAVFVGSNSPIPADPAANRIFFRIRNQAGDIIGSTSIAVSRQ